MPLNKITLNANAGPVTVEIVFSYAQVGAYSLQLWNGDQKTKTFIGEGVNTDQIPDKYFLPQPVDSLKGKFLDCLASILAPNPQPGERYRVDMVISQDGIERGREYDEGTIDTKSVQIRLVVELVC
ncbi:MAG: hypothetical protein V1799_01560 [bacterium]